MHATRCIGRKRRRRRTRARLSHDGTTRLSKSANICRHGERPCRSSVVHSTGAVPVAIPLSSASTHEHTTLFAHSPRYMTCAFVRARQLAVWPIDLVWMALQLVGVVEMHSCVHQPVYILVIGARRPLVSASLVRAPVRGILSANSRLDRRRGVVFHAVLCTVGCGAIVRRCRSQCRACTLPVVYTGRGECPLDFCASTVRRDMCIALPCRSPD